MLSIHLLHNCLVIKQRTKTKKKKKENAEGLMALPGAVAGDIAMKMEDIIIMTKKNRIVCFAIFLEAPSIFFYPKIPSSIKLPNTCCVAEQRAFLLTKLIYCPIEKIIYDFCWQNHREGFTKAEVPLNQ